MEKYINLNLLIESLESLLEEIFTGGFNVVYEGTLESIVELKQQCEIYGLSFAKVTLDKIHLGFTEKKHNLNYDLGELVKNYCVLNEYLMIIKRKWQREAALATLTEIQEEEID